MYALDFEYDGHYLSDYGFMICSFDDVSGTQTNSIGSNLTFTKVKIGQGKKYVVSGANYDECIQVPTLQICKIPNYSDKNEYGMEITHTECADIVRWLNREDFHKFRVIYNDETEHRYYYASFNIEKITIGSKLYGLQLTAETDSPHAYGDDIVVKKTINDVNEKLILYDMSEHISRKYLDMTITCKADGLLKILNETFNSHTVIRNCRVGEVITIDGTNKIITSSHNDAANSVNYHKIYNDFDFDFTYINSTLDDRRNVLSFSMPCDVEIRYTTIKKEIPL